MTALRQQLLKLLKQENLLSILQTVLQDATVRKHRLRELFKLACGVCSAKFVLLLLRNVATFMEVGLLNTLLFSATKAGMNDILEYILEGQCPVEELLPDCAVIDAAVAAAANNHATAAQLLLQRAQTQKRPGSPA